MIYDSVKDLSLSVHTTELHKVSQDVSSSFTRVTTVVHLRGDGKEGVGEDVTYNAALHDRFTELDLAGDWTLDSFSQHLEGLELFTVQPDQHAFLDYRRWAFESAALDLTLRQNGLSLAQALGRDARPVTFVASMRIDSIERLEQWIGLYPGLRLKLDPTSDWSEELIAAVAALGRVEVVDLKGQYKGTVVDQAADPGLYERVAESFPDAWIEDPNLDDEECDRVLRPHRERITWDAPIHSVEDIESLPFAPRSINIKPSRFGSVRKLLDAYEYCEVQGIGTYGGGQFELGPGRGHIQHFASLFSPTSPNDVAPGGYNALPASGLPESPLPPPRDAPGLGYR